MRGMKKSSSTKRRRTYNIDGNIFFCPKRYVPTKCLGKGSYGLVVSAKDKVKKGMCAIKRIAPLSKTTLDTKHILREIRLMRWLGSRHENILTLRDLYVFYFILTVMSVSHSPPQILVSRTRWDLSRTTSFRYGFTQSDSIETKAESRSRRAFHETDFERYRFHTPSGCVTQRSKTRESSREQRLSLGTC